MAADGTRKRRLAKSAFPASGAAPRPSWAPGGERLYYAKPGIFRAVSIADDLWAFDFRAGSELRITRGLGARDPDPSPDGRSLLFVQSAGGMTRLAVLDLAEEPPASREADVRALSEWSERQYSSPRWSPDGSLIAVAVWEPGGDKDVWILDRGGARLAKKFPESGGRGVLFYWR